MTSNGLNTRYALSFLTTLRLCDSAVKDFLSGSTMLYQIKTHSTIQQLNNMIIKLCSSPPLRNA